MSDYHGWILGQIALLGQGRFSALDVPNLVEELNALASSYRLAIESRKAAAETGLPTAAFPEQCPFTIEQVLNSDFLP
jgi:hypothetical protein